MPIELSKLIQDFARPITRVNWRDGGSFSSELFHRGINEKYYGHLVYMGMNAQSAEEYEYMLQDSSVPDWF